MSARAFIARSLVLAAVLTLSGCYASVSSEPSYAEAYYAPPGVYARPRATYDGRVVYLVDDRWYFYDRGRWFFYTAEPQPLYRERIIVRERPVVRHRHQVHRPPPAYERRREYRRRFHYDHAPASPRVAPPARRVR
jgi:hypothetical protein